MFLCQSSNYTLEGKRVHLWVRNGTFSLVHQYSISFKNWLVKKSAVFKTQKQPDTRTSIHTIFQLLTRVWPCLLKTERFILYTRVIVQFQNEAVHEIKTTPTPLATVHTSFLCIQCKISTCVHAESYV
jgi:hypothetical protein